MLSVLMKIWNHDQKDQIYLSLCLDILADVAGEYRAFIRTRFDPLSGFLRVHPTCVRKIAFNVSYVRFICDQNDDQWKPQEGDRGGIAHMGRCGRRCISDNTYKEAENSNCFNDNNALGLYSAVLHFAIKIFEEPNCAIGIGSTEVGRTTFPIRLVGTTM